MLESDPFVDPDKEQAYNLHITLFVAENNIHFLSG
jgi:hypothetical protein